jgi:hypothetical protein
METRDLTGIERQLVLQYLMDGNVPVTVTPADRSAETAKADGKITPLASAVFPVALKAEQITVLDQGIILLKNPPQSVARFAGKKVRVEFYFNKAGLFFETDMKSVKAGLALVIPASIKQIQETETVSDRDYEFSAEIYYSCSNKATVNLECIPAAGYDLFARPVWSSIALENQKKAKAYLEKFVADAKKDGKAGNGLQLIPVCRYLAEEKYAGIEAVQGRVKPFTILYVDHERIVFGSSNENFMLSEGSEYALRMAFSLGSGPVMKREVFATCAVSRICRSDDRHRTCADCIYTSLQEEDRRFLYEKATKKLFI